jgi:hypothetical protein
MLWLIMVCPLRALRRRDPYLISSYAIPGSPSPHFEAISEDTIRVFETRRFKVVGGDIGPDALAALHGMSFECSSETGPLPVRAMPSMVRPHHTWRPH